MIELAILRDLAWVVVGAAGVLLALRPFGVPPIVGFMLTGLLLGPVFGVLAVSESLHVFSELGVALLLFVVGLELSVDKIRDLGRPAVVGGVAQVIGMCALGTTVALLFGFRPTDAVFLGLAAAFSSTVVVVKLLDRAGDLQALHGRIAIGILLVEDVVVAIVLTVVAGLAGAGAAGAGGSGIVGALAMSLVGLVALVVAAAAAVRWLLPGVFRWLAGWAEAEFISAITWAFAFILAAEYFHLSIELGAFVAGVALAQLPFGEELRGRVHPLVDFFLAIFFVALGAGMDLGAATQHIGAVIALTLVVAFAGPVLISFILTRLGYAGRTAFLAGATLSQVSEFAFILLGVGVSARLIDERLVSVVGMVGLVTISISSFTVPRAARLYARIETRLPGWLRRPGAADEPRLERSGHIVVVGMNTLGREIVHRFVRRGERVLAVDNDREKLRRVDAERLTGTVDDPAVLEEAGIERAKLVVSALRIEDVNSMLVYRCAQLGVPISVHAHDPSFAHELLEIGADHLMVSKLDGIAPMQEALHRAGVIR